MKIYTNVLLIIALMITGNSIVNAQNITVTLAGNGIAGFSGDGGPANLAKINAPNDVCVDAVHNIYFVDAGNSRIRMVSAATGAITTVAGGGTSTADGVPAMTASIPGLTKMAIDAVGNLYVSTSNKIKMISPAGIITTVAGTGTAGYSGDGGAAISAELKGPSGICVDAAGNIYISDVSNNRIRKVSAGTGIISTIAGTGASGSSGDGGPATAATLSGVNSICTNASGTIFCSNGSSVRKITTAGIISTIGSYGGITGICADAVGNVYFDESSCGCHQISAATGAITTIARTLVLMVIMEMGETLF